MLQRLAILCSAAGLVMTVACSQTDPGITTAVKTKFAADTTVKAYQIDVDTSNGVVTLTGTVDGQAAKNQAITIARGTDGVTNVVDRITVGAAAGSAADHVGHDIGDATRTAGDKISDGADATKNAAERGLDATKNAAERGVDATKDAGRDIADRSKAAGEKTGDAITDTTITAAVKTKLLADGKTPGLKINVETNEGVVTLKGTVPSQAEIDKAVTDARGTTGVKRVVNNLKVGN